MRTTRYTVEPTLNLKRQVDMTGKLVKVVSGAHPSMRIYFEDPGTEDYAGQKGRPIRNGAVYMRDDGNDFTSFWLRGQTTQGPLSSGSGQERLCLEIIDCAQPVFLLNDNYGAGWRFHYISGASDVTEHTAATSFNLYTDNAWGATGIIDDPLTADYVPRGWIGGGVQADNPFTVVLLQHLTKNGTRKVELARWTADTKTINDGTDWLYGVSFETDGAPLVDSAKSAPNQAGTGLIPWPLFGLSISIIVGASDVNSLQWLLYSRGAMS